ncbi:MAG: peptidoglycan DD-metalloendopeptidase family protein [Bacteroidetes bacterium]|nr:peptidoglycan DD-metalloendopeptidase family protein [Bacteroidota bacterium]
MRRLLLLGCVLLLGVLPAWAQSSSDQATTEERLRALREQIQRDEERLAATSEAEEASMQTLRNLDRELATRRELVTTYQRRLQELNQQSDSLRASLATIEAELDEVRGEYQRHARHAYKYGRLHDLALILSAESINQMLVRIRYLNRFADERRDKYEKVRSAADTLEARRDQLQESREQTEALLEQAQLERQELRRLQRSRQQVVRQLQNQRSSIQDDLETKRQAATEFESRLRDLIDRADRSPTASRTPTETRILSGNFRNNRGRLPWPAEGVIIEPFGEIENPVYGTRTPNPGVFIGTNPQAEVKTVFDGTVLSVSVIPEFGRYVLIEHGAYQTAYSNFSLIYVSEGETVEAGQVIGRAGTEDEPKGAGVFFAVFEGGEAMDPSRWLGTR